MTETFDHVRELAQKYPDPQEARLLVEDAERDIYNWPGLKPDIIRRLINKLVGQDRLL